MLLRRPSGLQSITVDWLPFIAEGYRKIALKSLFSLFLFVLHAASAPLSTAETVLQDKHLIVIFERGTSPAADHFLKQFPHIKIELEQSLGLQLRSRPILKLVESPEDFAAMSGSPHFIAFTVPASNLIAMRVSPADFTKPWQLNDMLKHELCHLMLHENIEDSRLPRWLDEGVCQWVSGTVGEFLALGDVAPVDFSRGEMPLARLSKRFPAEKRQLASAYRQSRDFVQYVSAHYGRESVKQILQSLKNGEDMDSALMYNLNSTLATLESEWRSSRNGMRLLFIWLGHYLYEIIFFIAALLAVVSFIRRKAFIGRRDEEQEEDENEVELS